MPFAIGYNHPAAAWGNGTMHFLLFFVLLFVGRNDLQIRGVAFCIAIW